MRLSTSHGALSSIEGRLVAQMCQLLTQAPANKALGYTQELYMKRPYTWKPLELDNSYLWILSSSLRWHQIECWHISISKLCGTTTSNPKRLMSTAKLSSGWDYRHNSWYMEPQTLHLSLHLTQWISPTQVRAYRVPLVVNQKGFSGYDYYIIYMGTTRR